MSNEIHIQTSFLNMVKEKADQRLSFADELAELLDISKDSAYRRIRGETLLTFEEIGKISNRYHISIDSFLGTQTNQSIAFHSRTFDADFDFRKYLSSIRDHLELVNQFNDRSMIYYAKDIPPMHYYQFPQLAWFKVYFWQRTILNHDAQERAIFDLDNPDLEIVSLCKGIWNQFISVPSIEIWSDEVINITLRQIEYYHDISTISSEHTLRLINELMALIHHLRDEAKVGRKMHIGAENSGKQGTFQLYFNEIALGDNTAIFQMNEQRTVFLTYNMLNVLSTSNQEFCMNVEKYLNSIIEKSSLISSTSEKERNRFFNRMEAKIEVLKNKLALG